MNPLLDHLWQSTVFAGAVWLLTLLLAKNPARVRHGLWLAASCKFLLPFSILIALGGQIGWRTAPANASRLIEFSEPFTATAIPAPLLAAVPAASSLLPAILTGVWACGFLGIACSSWVRRRRIRNAVLRGRSVDLNAPIRIVCSHTPIEPGVFGIHRPVLLLPEGIFHRLSPAELQAVIAHELVHVRHRDNLLATIHMFTETLFWFQPLLWWIGKRMVAERERASDEAVLQQGNDPRVYAQSILKVCRFCVESPVACAAGVTGSNLQARIEAIMMNSAVHPLNTGGNCC